MTSTDLSTALSAIEATLQQAYAVAEEQQSTVVRRGIERMHEICRSMRWELLDDWEPSADLTNGAAR
ncbi:MAG TPA: hypothetical protein VGJ28_06130 [Micromonosporaceae bacterium]|jgi:hypothetical protein